MKKLFLGIAVLAVVGALAVFSPDAVFANPLQDACEGQEQSALCSDGDSASLGGIIGTIINILLWIAGVLAVIMIIISGIRYVTSAGNGSSVTAAKNTLLYSVIGLAVVMLAFVIVNFVINQF